MKWKVGGNKPPSGINYADFTYLSRTGFNLDACENASGVTIMKFSDSTLHNLREHAKNYNIALSLHGQFYSVVLCNSAKDYNDIYQHVGKSLRFAKNLSCPVVLHPGGNDLDDLGQTQLVISRLQEVMEDIEISPTQVYLETMGKVNSYGSLSQLLIISDVLQTRICVDWSHLFARFMPKFGKFTDYMIRNIIHELENTSWSKEMYFHISGMEYNQHGEVKHLSLDKSEMPWKMVLEEIINSSLEGRIIVESGHENASDAVKVKEFLNES